MKYLHVIHMQCLLTAFICIPILYSAMHVSHSMDIGSIIIYSMCLMTAFIHSPILHSTMHVSYSIAVWRH